MIRSVVKGSGSALPRRIVTNDELAQTVDTSDQWIRERTGIGQRYIAGEGETTATLATDACRAALADAGIDASAVDLIVLATATPDQTFPATATLVQDDVKRMLKEEEETVLFGSRPVGNGDLPTQGGNGMYEPPPEPLI